MENNENVTKEESIYIGDSSTDIQTAKNAEISQIWPILSKNAIKKMAFLPFF